MTSLQSKLESLIQPVTESLNVDFWGLELIMGGVKPTVRIYIDTLQGVGVDQCAEVSRELGAVFDAEQVPNGEYTLEVSSPGLDRILFTKEQCEQYLGSEVVVQLISAINGRRKYRATLREIDGPDVVLSHDDDVLHVPFHKIKRARLVPQLDKLGKDGAALDKSGSGDSTATESL